MNIATAITYIANVKWCAESCLLECPEDEYSFEVFCIQNPFLYGEKSLLPKCNKMLNDFVNDIGNPSPADFYEVVYKAFHCMNLEQWMAIAPMDNMRFTIIPDITWVINGWQNVDDSGQPLDKLPNVWYNYNGVVEDENDDDIIPS